MFVYHVFHLLIFSHYIYIYIYAKLQNITTYTHTHTEKKIKIMLNQSGCSSQSGLSWLLNVLLILLESPTNTSNCLLAIFPPAPCPSLAVPPPVRWPKAIQPYLSWLTIPNRDN